MLERGGGRFAMIDDPLAHLGREGRIVQDRLVGLKNRGLFRAHLASDFLVQGAQVRGRLLAGELEAA